MSFKFFAYLALPASVILAGCGQGTASSDSMRPVLTCTPVVSDAVGEQIFTGTVSNESEFNLGFKTAGQISALRCKEGQRVRAGALLAELDASDYELAVKAYQIQYDQLSAEVARIEKLRAINAVSGNDYEKAKAGLGQLKVQLDSYRNKVAYTKLYAPVSCIVQKCNFSVSEMVDAGTPVFSLLSIGDMTVKINVPASIYRNRDAISRYEAEVDGKTIPLEFIGITPKADETGLYRCSLGFGGTEDITSGMTMRVKVIMETGADGLFSVPASAVLKDTQGSYLFVVADGKAVRKAVDVREVGKDGMLQVSGLDGSEKIIRAGAHSIAEGQNVKEK